MVHDKEVDERVEYGEWLVRHKSCFILGGSVAKEGEMARYAYCPKHHEMYDYERRRVVSVRLDDG